jgi:methionine-rich copper-binding protein CopC
MHTILRVALIIIGLALLLFGLAGLFVPRALFVSSNPAPGSVVAEVPAAVSINFSEKLAAESTIAVTSTIKRLPSGEIEYLGGSSVVTRSGIDPNDASGKTLRADLQPNLHQGLYWVNWRTTAAGWRTVAYGHTVFGVGMPIPEHITKEMEGTKWEHAYQWRSGRATLVGGVILIVLGLLLPRRVSN